MAEPVTSFEIFHDVDRGLFPTASAEAAIGYIGSIIGEYTIASQRQIRIARAADTPVINVSRIRWPRLRADINVVLTDRDLSMDVQQADGTIEQIDERLGAAILTARVAIINTAQSLSEIAAVTHEIGHLFALKSSGATKTPTTNHCMLRTCVMYESAPLEFDVVRSEAPASWKQRLGLAAPSIIHSTEVRDAVHPFCTECAEQLGSVALLRNFVK